MRLLDISNNKLRQVPREVVTAMPALEILKMNTNFIKELPLELFAKGKRLIHISASNNLLTTVPELSSAEDDGEVVEDDDDFERLFPSSEKALNSSREGIQSLESEIFTNVCNLEYFDISVNKLKDIAYTFAGGVPRLKALHVKTNDFTTLPTSLCLLTELQEFSLDWYQYTIPSLPGL